MPSVILEQSSNPSILNSGQTLQIEKERTCHRRENLQAILQMYPKIYPFADKGHIHKSNHRVRMKSEVSDLTSF
jgi:hypothetical protein